jgi:hypothetical protein
MSRLVWYYQEWEMVTVETIFTTHSPRQKGLIRDTENTERSVLMENREVPILHELPCICDTLPTGRQVCLCGECKHP